MKEDILGGGLISCPSLVCATAVYRVRVRRSLENELDRAYGGIFIILYLSEMFPSTRRTWTMTGGIILKYVVHDFIDFRIFAICLLLLFNSM